MMNKKDRVLVNLARKRVGFPGSMSDEEVLDHIKDTYWYAFASLGLEVAKTKKAIRDALTGGNE